MTPDDISAPTSEFVEEVLNNISSDIKRDPKCFRDRRLTVLPLDEEAVPIAKALAAKLSVSPCPLSSKAKPGDWPIYRWIDVLLVAGVFDHTRVKRMEDAVSFYERLGSRPITLSLVYCTDAKARTDFVGYVFNSDMGYQPPRLP